MKKCIFFLLSTILFFSGNAVYAQNKATQLLDKVAIKYDQSKGISAQFTLETRNSQNRVEGSMSGTLKMQGLCFALISPDMMTWYDGKNQWAFVPSSNEVNLSTPTQDEIQSVNPYILLKTYKKGFKSYYKGKSNGLEKVELVPLQKNNDISKVILDIDPVKLYPVTITVYNSNKTSLNIHVTKYLTGQNFKNSEFVFNKKEFPQAEIIDLR